MAEEANEYELRRLQNIARNEEFLKAIGLTQIKHAIEASKPAPSTAWENFPETKKYQKKRNRREQKEDGDSPRMAPRRSLRQTRSSGGSDITQPQEQYELGDEFPARKIRNLKDTIQIYDDTEDKKLKITFNDLERFIGSNSQEHLDMLQPSMIGLCVKRINEMSLSQLVTRMRKLENPQKIIAFYYGLTLAGLSELADVAKKIAIERKIMNFHSLELHTVNAATDSCVASKLK